MLGGMMMKVTVTGGTGFIGSVLVESLKHKGHEVTVLTRNLDKGSVPGIKYRKWSCRMDDIDEWKSCIDGSDAVINLSGESISEGRWSSSKKEAISISRVECTSDLVEAVRLSTNRPKLFISGSAVGYYGPGGDEKIIESDKPGTDFMSKVCVRWEEEALKSLKMGVRVAVLRTGIVLGDNGGALNKLVQSVRLGFGGRIGSGQQWMSWIHMEDLVNIILFIMENNDAKGPFNGTALYPVRNKRFMEILGKVLERKPRFSIPSFAVRLMAGKEFADLALLSGQRVIPEKITNLGFHFKYTDLEEALGNILKR